MKLWPFTRAAATPETKSLASPDAALEALFGLTPTATGITLSAQAALRVPVVANAIQLISEAVASLDIFVKRIEGGSEIDVPDHPVLDLLRGEANEWTTSFELIRQIVVDALMNDAGGLAWVNRVGSEPREIIRYRPGAINFDLDVETGERFPENAAAITVGNTDVRYPHLQEYGTSFHAAQPFFWPGFRMGRKRVLNRIKRAIGKAIREAK